MDCETLPTDREFIDAVWASVTRLYGEVGASQTGLSLIDFDTDHKRAVIRVSLFSFNMVRASLATITALVGKQALVEVLSVSGTLRSLYSAVK